MKTRLIDLTGQKYGRLTVLAYSHKRSYGKHEWRCACECGKEITTLSDYLRSGKKKSCGCWLAEVQSGKLRVKHGCATRVGMTRTYRAWLNMKARCNIPTCATYGKYGGRGIKVCDSWNESFDNFQKDMGECPNDMSIERLDVNGNYEPSNCVWATRSRQSRNKRNTLWVAYRGQTKCLADWAEELAISYGTAQCRLLRGWTPEETFEIPVHAGNRLSKIRHG